jgi:hypothetical protein
MKNPLSEHALKEVGERRRLVLEAAGLDTLEALAGADPQVLAELQGFYRALGERVVQRAAERLRELDQHGPVPELGPPSAAPQAREDVRVTLERVQQARKHARGAKAKTRSEKARRALKSLREQLEHLYARVLGGEVDAAEWDDVAPAVRELDRRLRRFLDRKPRKPRLERVRKAAREASRVLP